MLVDFYGVMDVNGQDNYLADVFDDYYEELDCQKENDAIFCKPAIFSKPASNDYDYDTLPL